MATKPPFGVLGATWVLSLSAVLAQHGCTARMLGLDDYRFEPGGTGGASEVPESGRGGSPSSGGNSSGGGVARTIECTEDRSCVTIDNGCQRAICTDGKCSVVNERMGSRPCTGGLQCDGKGSCVRCLVNGERESGETDVDCGGSEGCERCDDGKTCLVSSDCKSRRCAPSPSKPDENVCFPGECTNGKLDGHESDVDCGGSECVACAQGRACESDDDCARGNCENGVCCGVPCDGTCETCTLGSGACARVAAGLDVDDRCAGEFNVCTAGGTCSDCQDGKLNGTESSRDCGGDVCARCEDGRECRSGGDCVSEICEGQRCQPPRCANHEKEGSESDVDCGGLCPSPCGVGRACGLKSDCASGSCVGKRCVP